MICEEPSGHSPIFKQEEEIRELFKSIISYKADLSKEDLLSYLAPLNNLTPLVKELEQLIQN